MKTCPFLSLLFSLLFFSHSAGATTGLVFEAAWVAEAPPASKVLAAYMEISNPGDQVVKVISARSASFERVTFHQTQHKNGMTTMQHRDALTIPANGKQVLKAGSYHMMLFNPVKKLTTGDAVNFDFELENGEIIKLTVPVKKQGTDQNSHHHSELLH